jgi:circadian clock protein KaiC
VILLDHRVQDQISTRRLRVVKYRGSHHGTNEYPFLIGADGITVLPVTSLGLQHPASMERVSSGIDELDGMLDGRGFFRGSTILVSGTAGTGKTSLAAHFVDAACRRGEQCLAFLLEESPSQVIRNMRSIGLDLQPAVDRGLLAFHADRPTRFGLEQHLAAMYEAIRRTKPSIVIIDPVSNLLAIGSAGDVHAMLTRIIDHLKTENITGMITNLTPGKTELHETDAGISSLMDTWILLSADEVEGVRRRNLVVLKSRGMAQSIEIREFEFSPHGFELRQQRSGSRSGRKPGQTHGG